MDIKIPQSQNIDINLLKVDGCNPNELNAKQRNALKENFKKFGFIVPIITNKDYVVADGQHRWEIAKEMGMTHVPVIALEVSEVDRKILRQVLNKLHGEHQFDLDALEFKIIQDSGGINDLSCLADISLTKINFALDSLKQTGEDDFEIPKEPKYKIEQGEIWQLGEHRLMCGDCTIRENVDKLMGGAVADMVLTDPPYGIDLDTDYKSLRLSCKLQFLHQKNPDVGKEYKPVIGDNKIYNPQHIFEFFNYCNEIFLWGADYYSELIPNRNEGSFFVWDKTEGGIRTNSAYDKMYGSNFELCWSKTRHKRQIIPCLWKGIFGLSKDDTKKRIHPTQKPTKLCSWFIKQFSKEKDKIVDLFGGSGSILIACEQLNRKCYMMEIDPYYCSVIIERWEKFTGKKAVKL